MGLTSSPCNSLCPRHSEAAHRTRGKHPSSHFKAECAIVRLDRLESAFSASSFPLPLLAGILLRSESFPGLFSMMAGWVHSRYI